MPIRGDTEDRSNGYDAVAAEYMAARERSAVGVEVIRDWARSLRPGSSVLDLGCGHGVPVATTLCDAGLSVYGIDGSLRLVAEFRRRLPDCPVACEAAEESNYFGRRFHGIVIVGLVFLLPETRQYKLIRRAATALDDGGYLLLNAPAERGAWTDLLTGRRSWSAGDEAYRAALRDAGLQVVSECRDEGDNHYYNAVCVRATA